MFIRFAIVFLVAFSSAKVSYSQIRVGLRVAPQLSTTRITESNEGLEAQGAGLRFGVGPEVDYFFYNENVALSTGLRFSTERVGLARDFPTAPPGGVRVAQSYELQFLELPLELRFLTNEISLDTKLYFTMGGSVKGNISSKAQDPDPQILNDLAAVDLSTQLGAGLERKVGASTILFAGLRYSRGLLNQNSDEALDGNIKLDALQLDAGLRF